MDSYNWKLRLVAIAGLWLALAGTILAQEEKPRYILTLPPGFQLVEAAGYKAICRPDDEPWVKQTLETFAPTTRPSTMPADLFARLAASREQVIQQIATDFAVSDTAGIAKRFDELATELERLRDFRPPLFFLCITPQQLKALLRDGQWTTPSLYYNRLADDVAYRETLPLTAERPMDDTLMTVLLREGDDAAANAARLTNSIAKAQQDLSEMVSGRALFLCQAIPFEAVLMEVFKPLELPPDQRWFAVGISGARSADYGATLTGSPERELLLLVAAELRNNPIRVSTIDLLNPPAPNSVRRQYVPLVSDAFRRKSISVAARILEADPLPRLITSIREDRPGTGEELLKRIHEITGVDVSADVRAR